MTTKPNQTCLGKPSTDWDCEECGEKATTVYIGRSHDGVNVCLPCVCKAFEPTELTAEELAYGQELAKRC